MTDSTQDPKPRLSKALRFQILRRDNHACLYCGAAAPDAKLTVDHVVPRSLGGTNDLATACASCNTGKAGTPPDAGLVEDVNARDLQWARASALAAEQQRAEYGQLEDIIDWLPGYWHATVPYSAYLPDDWAAPVSAYWKQGFTLPDFTAAINIVARKRISRWDQWAYFNGTCKGILNDRRDRAQRMIEDGDV